MTMVIGDMKQQSPCMIQRVQRYEWTQQQATQARPAKPKRGELLLSMPASACSAGLPDFSGEGRRVSFKGAMETQLASQAHTAQALLSFLILRRKKGGGGSIKELGSGQGILLLVRCNDCNGGLQLAPADRCLLAGYRCSPWDCGWVVAILFPSSGRSMIGDIGEGWIAALSSPKNGFRGRPASLGIQMAQARNAHKARAQRQDKSGPARCTQHRYFPTRASLFAHARESDRLGRFLVGEQRRIAMSRTRQSFLAVLF